MIPQNGKLCILRLSAIGDVCHAVAMVERVQRMRPDIQITWIIGKVEHMLVGDIPNINFIIFDKSKGSAAYAALKANLGNAHFDALFLMQLAFRANIASLSIKAKVKIGFDWSRSKELHSLFVRQRIASQNHPHVLEGFMAFADKAGIPDGGSPRWHIPLADEQLQMARGHKERLGEYAVICPSASSADRTWTIENYQQIAVYLSNLGYPVVLVGGPHESEREIADLIENCGHVKLNLVGETSLKELLAVLKEARLVIAPDTGPAHMATAAGTDVIGLYAHSNPRRTGPYNNIPQVVSIYEDVIQEQKGKPWQKLPWGTRAKGWNLMCRISVDAVKKKIDKILKTD